MGCQIASNKGHCTCLHTECSKHGICCECLKYHLSNRELPACCFPEDVARTDERSFSKFCELNS